MQVPDEVTENRCTLHSLSFSHKNVHILQQLKDITVLFETNMKNKLLGVKVLVWSHIKKHASDQVKVKFNAEHSHPEVPLVAFLLFPTSLQQGAVQILSLIHI